MTTRITFVTGVSGSGKTTLHDQLDEAGQELVVELDDCPNGLPNAAHVEWLQWRAAEHLHEATERARDGAGQHMVVTGIVWPFALVNSDTFDAALEAGVEVRFVLLDRPWSDIEQAMSARLTAEGWDHPDIVEQLVLNRRQYRSLRRQVNALATMGRVIVDGDLADAANVVQASAVW